MSKKETIDIKIKPTVDGDELDALDKKIADLDGEEVNVKVTADDAKGEINEFTNIVQTVKKDGTIDIRFENNAGQTADEVANLQKKVDEIDGASPKVKPTVDDQASDEIDNVQKKADDLDGASPKIKPVVDDSEALGSLANIQSSVDNLSGVEAGISAAIGGLGIEQLLGGGVETAINLDKSWRNWVGSLQEAGMGITDAKKRADQFYSTINKLASQGQSNDSFFKSIAGLVVNLNTQVSDSTLAMTEKVVAGYEMLGARSGATFYEMEKELKNFLSTGDLGKMQDTLSSLRDPEKWIGLLEGADTVEERLNVLRDMLQEEGIMGALDIDAPSKSIDQLKALFEAGMTSIGTTLISIIQPIADFFLWLDEVTGGASTTIMSVAAVVALFGLAFLGIVALITPAIVSLGGFTLAAINAVLPMLGMNASVMTLSGGFRALGSAIWASLKPLLPFIAVGLAVAAAVYLIGQYFGWWKDIPTMIEAIKAGVMRLWDAFVNNKHVQAVIEWIKAAWQGVMAFLKPVFDAITGWWNSLFPPQDGGFDIVRSIIDLFGLLGDGIASVVGVFVSFGQAVAGVVGGAFNLLLAAFTAISSVLKPVTDALLHLGSAILGRLIEGWNALVSALKPVTDALMEFFGILGGGAADGANDTFSRLWGVLSQVWGIIVQVGTALQGVLGPVLTEVANIVTGFFGAAWTTVSGILTAVIGFIAEMINILSDLIEGNVTFGEAMQMVWGAINLFIMSIINSIMMGIGQFALDMWNQGLAAAQGFFNNIVIWLSQLPGRAWSYFLSTLNSVLSFATMAWNYATRVGQNIVNAIQGYLAGLPAKMYQWGTNAINSFINAIIDAIPGLRAALDQVASLFPQSPPKEGPLSKITMRGIFDWGKTLGESLSLGVNSATGDIFSNLALDSDIGSSVVYPEQKQPVTIILNGLVTEQGQIDFIQDLFNKGKAQNDMRS